MLGPAAIDAQDPRKMKIEDIIDATVPERFVQVRVCIVLLLMMQVSPENCCEKMKFSGGQTLVHRLENDDFLNFPRFSQDFQDLSGSDITSF